MKAFRKFKMDWKTKALAFKTFDRAPFGHDVYYFVQRRVTKTIPRALSPTAYTARWFTEHARVLGEHAGAGGIGGLSLFEFGAGWDLYGNCVAWCLGAERQTVYDLTRWAKPDQINVVLEHLRREPPPGAVRVPETLLPTRGAFEPDLLRAYGITYLAPADAGATGLPDGSIDSLSTTSVLEHVPVDQIIRILTECHRLLPPGSIMSHVIDYSDHYAHSDPLITPYNFLSLSAEQWRRYNPGIHYQNRLRHADYAELFKNAGFEILSARCEQPEDAAAMLRSVSLSAEFRSRPTAVLAPLVGHYVVRRV